MAEKRGLVEPLRRWRNPLILAVLALTVLLTEPLAERYGDRFQVVLPVLTLGCTFLTGGTGEYVLRFLVLEAAVHGTKAALADAPLNQRPRGGLEGFPSGHTAAATFGASALVHDCIAGSPVTKAAVILSAGFTGASRIEARAHNIWQVLAGVLVGWLVERLFRRGFPARPYEIWSWLRRRSADRRGL